MSGVPSRDLRTGADMEAFNSLMVSGRPVSEADLPFGFPRQENRRDATRLCSPLRRKPARFQFTGNNPVT